MNNLVMSQYDDLIKRALIEDIPFEDLSTNAIYSNQLASVDLIAKENGILAGINLYKRVFTLLDNSVHFSGKVDDGQPVKKGEIILTIKGNVKTLLSGERVALNFLQRLSGIATKTHQFIKALEGSNIKLLDTRKTTPGWRKLEKYAVKMGGGYNHRFSLSDAIMLKDNHIAAAGSVKKAIQMARQYDPYIHKIEVEVESLDMVEEAIIAGADIIMLDNMSREDISKAIELINHKMIIEVSGNITLDNLNEYKDLKFDYLSSGAITHSAGIIDLSMKNLTIIN